MFGNMRQLPEEVVKDWDRGQPEVHPYQKRLRDVRLARDAKQRFVYLCVVGASLIVGFVAGHFSPLVVLGVLAALIFLSIIVQAGVWFRRQMTAMEAGRKIDEGIKIIEPIKKEEEAA